MRKMLSWLAETETLFGHPTLNVTSTPTIIGIHDAQFVVSEKNVTWTNNAVFLLWANKSTVQQLL